MLDTCLQSSLAETMSATMLQTLSCSACLGGAPPRRSGLAAMPNRPARRSIVFVARGGRSSPAPAYR